MEWNGAGGGLIAWNIYGPGADEILWRYKAGVGHLRYHTDKEGSVNYLLDVNGNPLERYSYDAFGWPTVVSWTGSGWDEANPRHGSYYGNRFMFTGREFFAEMGVYDYRHRVYHPGIGRFLQTDPKSFAAGDNNLFRYCADDPVDMTDPTGMLASLGFAERFPGDISFAPGLHSGTSGSSIITSGALEASWYGGSSLSLMSKIVKGQSGNVSNKAAPQVDPTVISEGMTATNVSVQRMDKTGKPHSVVSYIDENGRQVYSAPQPGILKAVVQGHEQWSEISRHPGPPAVGRIVGHSHKPGSPAFSPDDQRQGWALPVMKNRDGNGYHGQYDMFYRGWRYYIDTNGRIEGHPFRY